MASNNLPPIIPATKIAPPNKTLIKLKEKILEAINNYEQEIKHLKKE